ncbi:cell division protein FtsZ [Rubellicoccus peritrichatus]|uniref:Cell division protein FtsZ n=1 Tax=Rubellicoccus peritrichatus TaxID=3080537 RepID=A0AAQ3LGU2_9BACT|nr:cell division protein FtsZ [Puniceicoccus sp. CR14]WOO43558.1 cell division protein FtsZ [Puniceicoccus sp. CR14]
MEDCLKATDTDLASQSMDGLRIKIIGVGGAGTNTVDRLQLHESGRAQLAAINTDAQALAGSPIPEKVMIGRSVTRGLSAGGSPEMGRKAAEADSAAILNLVSGMDLVFILVGLGGGTGSGAAPIVARAARDQGALVVTFATQPFSLEGGGRLQIAEEALGELRLVSDAVIPLPNDLLLQQAEEDATVLDAFEQADAWIGCGVRSICSMLFETGLINVDFATLRKAFCAQGGKTLFGLGRAEGDDFVDKALEDLAMCPLLHTPEYARKADRLLVNIIGGTDLGIAHVNKIMAAVTERFGSKADTVLGAVIDDSLRRAVEICVIGTTDVGGGGRYVRKSAKSLVKKPKPPAPPPFAETQEAEPQLINIDTGSSKKPSPRVHQSKLRRSKEDYLIDQEEFLFVSEQEQRGYFDKTDRNLFEGEDLDVPTYLRRGIRVSL